MKERPRDGQEALLRWMGAEFVTDPHDGEDCATVEREREEYASELLRLQHELVRLREIERRVRWFLADPRFVGVHNTLEAILRDLPGEEKG